MIAIPSSSHHENQPNKRKQNKKPYDQNEKKLLKNISTNNSILNIKKK